MGNRSKFAGGDQNYLRDEQYRDATLLAKRARLHKEFNTAEVGWFDWVAEWFDLQPGQSILECGCGAGWLWEETSIDIPTGVSITFTDLSEGMVAEATSRVASLGLFADVAGQAADLQALPFESGTFDRVVANHMLYHLPDPETGVAELARVIRSDGVVVAATNGSHHMRELWSIRAEVFGMAPVDNTLDVFGADVGFPVLRRHFADVRWEHYEDSLRVSDNQAVLDYLCSTPPGETADQGQLDDLTNLIDAAFVDGHMHITKDVGVFTCRSPR
ncbi:MAG: methyltransferase domain-containing protein [Actinomycetia bacterium]|nr:methyltransferase domain-containing protein [Actinomycetes bacterium]MCP4963542.1 methyltransferase domain-containing protein [Actinomycetes bacterium]